MNNGYYQFETGRVAAIDGDCQDDYQFPILENALVEPNGLIAIGGDLSVNRLLSAYSQGIFPWSNYDPLNINEPICWYSPNPRMVLHPNELKISQSLKKTIKKQIFDIRFNTAFKQVITACSQANRQNQAGNHQSITWISPQMIDAYTQLHELGHAISCEAWVNNILVGGCYGVKIGCMFYGESMFHTQTDASKVAFVHLVQYLQTLQIGLIDCQMKTPLLANFGGREIPRDDFAKQLKNLVKSTYDVTKRTQFT